MSEDDALGHLNNLTEAILQLTFGRNDVKRLDRTLRSQNVNLTFVYVDTLIQQERVNEMMTVILQENDSLKILSFLGSTTVESFEIAKEKLMTGHVLIQAGSKKWFAVSAPDTTGRAIESSDTETILYGAKDSFTEQINQNIMLIRRRIKHARLCTHEFKAGSLTRTKMVLMSIDGITNSDVIQTVKNKLKKINFDMILNSSNVAEFIEDHTNSIFPQFEQTDLPDYCADSLGKGKIVLLIENSPFVLIGPTTFFDLFTSPEDYIHKWLIASSLRIIRYIGFVLSLLIVPIYVALTTHHYQMIPLQILYVLTDSRNQLPFSPFWEAFFMLFLVEILKEASLRMPSKTSQTLGIVGGIVIGDAAVRAGFVSVLLIVLIGVSAIASFLVPNYLLSKTNTIIQFVFLILSFLMGFFGIIVGLIGLLAHLNGLTSLKKPYLAPVAPFYWSDWKDFLLRFPIPWMKTRPDHLEAKNKWRITRRR
ncbi:spore germination protein [Bacillaceae bacterium SIJ1]|uniref:spore germination protein n=1 Tax=Litoribacterium kuwaitense TaxID=1398745 RepID=UPI0013EAA001|nr:spore germination protein [Litoribacterium kuwaitense]NGP46123.1 spore germination protein [Litoribacterium kuwaitense]